MHNDGSLTRAQKAKNNAGMSVTEASCWLVPPSLTGSRGNDNEIGFDHLLILMKPILDAKMERDYRVSQ